MLADIDELEKDIDIVDLLESPVEEPAAWLHYLNVRIRDDVHPWKLQCLALIVVLSL